MAKLFLCLTKYHALKTYTAPLTSEIFGTNFEISQYKMEMDALVMKKTF